MRTAIYVDGFNLYHSALEARPQYRWLDLHALALNALGEGHEIVRIRYFTARIKGEDGDHDGPQRQDAYTRALGCACPNLTVHWGRFVQREKWKRIVDPPARCLSPAPTKVLTWHREEKRSDVNLAVHLLNDAWRNEYECAVLLSDDSDLAEPLSIVREMGKRVILLTPIHLRERGERTPNSDVRVPARDLLKHAHAYRHISVSHLAASQMPAIVRNHRNGRCYRRPATWSVRSDLPRGATTPTAAPPSPLRR
jgi:uncharacterized LabA/DUF88 family protein